MPAIQCALGQCALAIATILSIAAIEPLQNLQLTAVCLHQAFWCCVVETAVWCPVEVITYLLRRKGHIPQRILQKLTPIISFFWGEMNVHIVAQLVQPSIVHASLSPALATASTTTTNAPSGSLVQCVILLCFFQIIHIVSLFVRHLQNEFKWHADKLSLGARVDQTCVNRLHALSLVHACVGHLLTTAALYLDRMAVGILVTSRVIAHRNLEGTEYWAFSVAEGVLWLGAQAHAFWKALEWDAEVHEMQPDQQGERQVRQHTMLWMVIHRKCLYRIWNLGMGLRKIVSGRVPGLVGACPELAALWPKAELRKFYVESLSKSLPLALLAPRSHWHAAIREQYVDPWRRAGLTRDFVLRDYSVIPFGAPTEWLRPLCYMALEKIIMVLVYLLEAAFAWFFFLFSVMACTWLAFH